MKISDFLGRGAASAITARQLCQYTGLSPRRVTLEIEKARREGEPICAACGEVPGYYLASTAAEMQEYTDRLLHRGRELFRTRQACLKALSVLSGSDQAGMNPKAGEKAKEKG